MKVFKNPTKAEIKSVIAESAHTAAKWLKDSKTGDTYYWPAEQSQHAAVAEQYGIADYTKGIAVVD